MTDKLIKKIINEYQKGKSSVALCQACVQGMGIGMISDYLAAPALARGELVEVMPELKFPDIWLKALVPVQRLDVPRISMLLQWLSQHLQLEQIVPEAGA